MSVFSVKDFDQHELVVFRHDEQSGLNAIIAIHNTELGPAMGGCRMYPYASSDEALGDVLRLSRGMTYKSALAGLPLGGGKAVIIGDPKKDKSRQLLLAMGEFIDSLGGIYITAEDSGTGVEDIKTIATKTRYVSGINPASRFQGDPSPSTAYGVFVGILAAVKHKLGMDKLTCIRVAVQGVGNVGYYLTELLTEAGAQVFVADIAKANVARVVADFNAIPVSADDIIGIETEIFCPCAMGAVLTEETVDVIQAEIVAGAANNQLAEAIQAEALCNRDILYAPDFVINAGGIIDVYYQRTNECEEKIRAHIKNIENTLAEIFQLAKQAAKTTHEIAEELARERITRPLKRKVQSQQVA